MKLVQKLGLAYYRANLQLLSLVSPKKAAKQAFKIFSTPFNGSSGIAPPVFEEGELLSFHLENILISGFRWNHPARKKVLIVHGFESSSTNFHQYISALIKLDFEVLAFDAPAHGRSGGKRILLPDYVNTIHAAIERFGPVDYYIAHSFGGLALMHALETIPDDEVSKVALIAPATETTSAVDRFFRIFNLNQAVRKHFDELVIKRGGMETAHYSIRRAINHTKASILWVHDDTDKITPIEDAIKVKNDGHAHLEFLQTTGLGHRRIYKDEVVIKMVLDFLKK